MNLVINDIQVRKNNNGLFCINDLHKAAGGENKIKPAYFFGSVNTQRYIEALEKVGNPDSLVSRIVGRNGGTYVCQELVYKYAAWINADFDVLVFKTFIDMTNSKTPPATMAALNELTKKIESDKSIASKCGKALAHYKKVKKDNENSWLESVNNAQLNLGFNK